MKKGFVLGALVLLCVASSALADCSTLTNITEVVPQLFVGQHVNFDFEFSGGTPPYHFVIVDGTLPPGLHLNPNGKLVGTPTVAGDTVVFIQVTDNAGCTLTVAYPISVM